MFTLSRIRESEAMFTLLQISFGAVLAWLLVLGFYGKHTEKPSENAGEDVNL